jgi:hypothetical protein
MTMETNDNKPSENAPEANNAGNPSDQDLGNSLQEFPKADLLDLQKGARAMDRFGGNPQPIEGRTISGTGSGPGTGDWGGDFDRPGSPEGAPAKNDYVEHALPPDDVTGTTSDFDDASGTLATEGRQRPADAPERANDSAYLPGSGAVRTAEDRIPPAPQDENAGISPEEGVNDLPIKQAGDAPWKDAE